MTSHGLVFTQTNTSAWYMNKGNIQRKIETASSLVHRFATSKRSILRIQELVDFAF